MNRVKLKLLSFKSLLNIYQNETNRQKKIDLFYLFFDNVLCFSAFSTTCSSTNNPFRFLTESIYNFARFCESDLSPKCKYSSSVDGIQCGSISIVWQKNKANHIFVVCMNELMKRNK